MYSDENTAHTTHGVNKPASGAAFGAHDAKRGKVGTTLPNARPALGDIRSDTQNAHTARTLRWPTKSIAAHALLASALRLIRAVERRFFTGSILAHLCPLYVVSLSCSNRTTYASQDVVKKASVATTFPSVHPARLVEQAAPQQQAAPQHHTYLPQQQAAPVQQTVDPMDTTLEDSVADLSINPTATTVAASSASAYAPPATPYIAVDEADKLNAQMCSEYGPEIQAYWRASEMRRAPSPTYMSKQNDINPKMREILVDWMVS